MRYWRRRDAKSFLVNRATFHWLSVLATLTVFSFYCGNARARSLNPATIEKTPQLQVDDQEATLELGKPLERELSGEQSHSYVIQLSEGQYASLIVDQRGIDVVVQVPGKDGRASVSFDGEYRSKGEEKVEVVAEANESFRLNIRSSSKSAPIGKYVIRVVEIRPVTKNDRLMAEARQLEADHYRARLAGNYQECLQFAERALAITQEVLGNEHPFVARLLYQLSNYYDDKEDFAQSQLLQERALAISEESLGEEHSQTISILASLAFSYLNTNEIAKATRLAERAAELGEKTLGPEHPFVASCLITLAQVTREPKKHEQLLQRALMIAEKTCGLEHDLTANVLNQLGTFYTEKGDYGRGETLLLRAKAIREKTRGPENISHVVNLHNLGRIARDKKDYAKAEAYYQKAIAIVEKVFDPENSRLAIILNNLANVYRARGEYAKSLEAHLRVLRISESTKGPFHPLTLQSLGNIAKTYAAQGSIAEAIKFQMRVDAVIERNIELNLAIGSERQKLSYLNSIAERTDRTVSLNVGLAPGDANATALAALVLLQRKGRVLDATSASFAALRERSTPEEKALIQEYNDAITQLARLVLNGPQQLSFTEHQKRVAEFEERKERLEAEISHRSAEFRTGLRPVALSTVQAAIPANAALVEFAVYRPFDPKAESNSEAYKEPRYVAYILRHNGEVRWRDLGEARLLDDTISALRESLRDPLKRDASERARKVDESVMRPIRALIGDVDQLLISPDGALNLIPFEALVDEQNRYLIQRYSFTYLTSGRDLLRLQTRRESKSPPVVLADPTFGEPAVLASGERTGNGVAPTATQLDLSRLFFGPLPGVGHELRALKGLLPKATFLTKEQATEATLKRVSGPSILHLATHGFFLQNDAGSATRVGKIDNPLLRSGLALAGANQGRSGTDDGVLTALEATALDLWGTKLVVLSACDTGVGEVRNGDGVYGLRRALVLAGTESQLMSLWPVSDRSTRDLMIGYYEGLVRDEGRSEALRRVQLQMLRSKSRAHPYYWASFILTGEWANLKGER